MFPTRPFARAAALGALAASALFIAAALPWQGRFGGAHAPEPAAVAPALRPYDPLN